MSTDENFYKSCIALIENYSQKSTKFLRCDSKFCDSVKDHLKALYDHSKKVELKKERPSALPHLIIDKFDVEQIWQQIELQNDGVISSAVVSVSKLVSDKNGVVFDTEEQIEAEESDVSDESKEFNDSIDEGNEEVIENEESSQEEETPTKFSKKSIVDDDFFKLSEMENFLQTEESKTDKKPDSDEESEESVDLFEAGGEEEDKEDDGKTARYKDFFLQKDREKNHTKDDFEVEERPSVFEIRQKRLQEKIAKIENRAVAEKPWQLKGEISAEDRPLNSLLEEIVEFDLSARPAPVITEQTSMQLEDIIRQRIKDKVFDSVERKTKTSETPLEYKKKLLLEQDKSKESLAQIYEREFLEQKANLENGGEKDEEVPELHKEINSMMKSLFSKLDALSNFHFTPKAAIPELKIISNLPAVVMEEITPAAVSDAALLAPEEIKRKLKGDEIGKGERTITDKKRERRKKKNKQKLHAKLQQTKEGHNRGLINKKAIKKNNESTDNEKIDKSLNSLRSSKAFFAQLEDQVKSQISGKDNEKKRSKNNGNKLSSKRLKL